MGGSERDASCGVWGRRPVQEWWHSRERPWHCAGRVLIQQAGQGSFEGSEGGQGRLWGSGRTLRECSSHSETRQGATGLTARFGGDIVGADGAIDRGVLAERAFVDARSLASLDEVMHPPLRAELSRQIDLFRADDRTSVPIVVDAALLLETDWHELCDIVVFVDAGEDCRRRRVAESRGWTAADLARRENLQKPLDIKRQIADYIVGNNSSVSRLRQQVRLLHQRLVNPSSFLFKDVDRPL